MVLQKLAIEKQFVGDSISGEFDEKKPIFQAGREGKAIGSQVEGEDDK
ncbi:hypothetical protein KLVA_28160 [Klebsiella variicola]|nr:hypothetical protein KLVA_28160 [Klebsiella variicola]